MTGDVIPPNVQQAMCHGKRLFFDALTADMHAPAAAKKAGKPVRSYQCPNCRFWHLTTQPVRA